MTVGKESREEKAPLFSSGAGLAAAFLLLLAAVGVAYEPAVTGGQVWDDNAYITGPALQPLSGLGAIWFKVGSTEQYYPVLHSAFWVEHRLWGDSTVGYHLFNILLHATAAFLFALILRRLFDEKRRSWAPWLAALIFALHPVCVESVAWISEEKNTLSTVFYLLAALTYLRLNEKWGKESNQEPSRQPAASQTPPQASATPLSAAAAAVAKAFLTPAYLGALALFILALLSKSVTATLPAALLVVLWWKRGRLSWKRDAAPLIPWFAIGAADGLFTGWVERRYIGAEGADFALGVGGRVLMAGRAVWFYLGKLLWPSNLTFIYPRWVVDTHALWQWLFPVGALAVTAGLWGLRARSRAPLAAWLFFVGSLFPTLGFLDVYAFLFSYVADHWQYLASLGVIAFVAAACPPRRWAAIAGVAAACVLGALTWRQCGMYRDGATLYETTLERNPDCWMACNNLAVERYSERRTAEAISLFRKALALRPDYVEAHTNLAVALNATGSPADAIAECRAALRLKPGYPQAHNNLGNGLLSEGRKPEALSEYETAVRLKPDYADAQLNLGSLLFQEGRVRESVAPLAAYAGLNPGNKAAYLQLAHALYLSGRLPEAGDWYAKVIGLDPDDADAQNDLGLVLAAAGRLDEAMDRYLEAIRITPGVAAAYFNLANAQSVLGRYPEAIANYEDALRLKPDYPNAENGLGVTLAKAGRLDDAVRHLEAALRLKADYPEAEKNLRAVRDLEAKARDGGPKGNG